LFVGESTRVRGREVPGSRDEGFGSRHVLGRLRSGGSEDPRRGRRRLQRGESPGEHRPTSRGDSRRRERTRKRSKASKRVKLAGRGGPVCECPGEPESVLRCGARDLIGDRGPRQARANAGVDETVADTASRIRLGWLVDDRKGAGGPERGARFLRGERSGGGRSSRTVAARNKAAKLGSARKPLRG